MDSILLKTILDRIYRIFRIILSFPGFPEESLETQSPLANMLIFFIR